MSLSTSPRERTHSTTPAGAAAGRIAICSTATTVPPYVMAREEVKQYMQRVFTLEPRRLNAIMAVVDHSQVKQRYSIFPLDYVIEPRPLAQINEEYREHSIRLGRQVACEALTRAGMKPADIDLFITVSCTGVMIPSLDAYLINDLGFRSDVRRLPITELGCAAGAAGLSRAWEYLRAFPERNVLLVSVELPTLTFQRKDISQANLISCALFGDGAAAAVISGGDNQGPQILGSQSYLFPQSLDAMGFLLKDSGFHIVLSKDVPQLIRSKIKELLSGFLERHSLTREQISAFVFHPGGQKLLAYIEEELGLRREQTQPSWDVLREYGNLSSASVLFVLHEWQTKRKMAPGDYGLLSAFGPGFSAEMLLLRWA
jgi:alkylresorcinol/alkylpyrone synthase